MDARKLAGVVRDQSQPEASRVGRDEQIIGADHCSQALLRGTNLSIVGTSPFGEVQDLDIGQETAKGRFILPLPARHLNTKEQFGLRDYRNADVAHRNFLQAPQKKLVGALHDIRADVCVEHVPQHYRSRSCTGRSSTASIKSADATGASAR